MSESDEFALVSTTDIDDDEDYRSISSASSLDPKPPLPAVTQSQTEPDPNDREFSTPLSSNSDLQAANAKPSSFRLKVHHQPVAGTFYISDESETETSRSNKISARAKADQDRLVLADEKHDHLETDDPYSTRKLPVDTVLGEP